MTHSRLLLALGAGALTVASAALPGSSASKQDLAAKQVEQQLSQALAEANAALQSQEVQKVWRNLEVTPDLLTDDDDQQVIISLGHGWLGVGVSEVTAEKVKDLKLPAERGVVLGKVVPDSPAAKAGLKENDVITEVNGQRVEGTEQFRRLIREIPVGRAAQFTVWRDGRSQNINVAIGKVESSSAKAMVAPAAPGAFAFQLPDMHEFMELSPWLPGQPRLGIDAEDLEGDFGNYFGAPGGEGVLVRGVFADSPASKAGVKVGDVITSVDGDKVRSIGDLREKLVEKRGQKNVHLGLLRNKASLSLQVEMPAPAEKHERHNSVRTNI